MEPGYIRPRLRASLPFTLDHGIFSRIDIGVKIRQRYEKKKKKKKEKKVIGKFRGYVTLQISKSNYYAFCESSQLWEIYILFDEKVNSDVILIYQYRENVLYVYVWNSREYIYIGILHVSNL